ncbi:hypothetical protein LguiA_019166 [Lonicera macranthoides]
MRKTYTLMLLCCESAWFFYIWCLACVEGRDNGERGKNKEMNDEMVEKVGRRTNMLGKEGQYICEKEGRTPLGFYF